jgi:hypothetical protein
MKLFQFMKFIKYLTLLEIRLKGFIGISPKSCYGSGCKIKQFLVEHYVN